MIIGLTGEIGAGKTTTEEIIGFPSFSTTDEIREELKKKGKEITRTTLRDMADILREEKGEGILSERAAEKIKKRGLKKAIVDSIRHPGEVLALKRIFGDDFLMVAVKADLEKRYNRIIERKKYKEEEKPSFEEFKRLDNYDKTIGIGECIELSDVVIENNGTISELKKKVEDEILSQM